MLRFASVLLFAVVSAAVTVAQGEAPAAADRDRANVFAQRVLAVVDLVLKQHVDPPVRQHLVLQALRGLAIDGGDDDRPIGLSERVSSLARPEEFRDLLIESWDRSRTESKLSSDELEARVLARMLAAVPGEARLAPAKEYAVEQQLAANQYVGTGISLSMEDGRPTMREVFEDGPAHRAGGRSGDLIEQIDGAETTGKPLTEIVSLLRGPAGSQVTVVLRQPNEDKARTCTITRGEVVLKTVEHKQVDVEGRAPLGYVRIVRVSSSTPHELRRLEPMLRGIEGLALDLRSLRGADLHQAVLLADVWLDGGPIGRMRTRDGVKDFEAAPDCVFRGLPLVVLVDAATSGAAEWLAAALQSQRDATIVGWPTSGDAYVVDALPIAESDQVLVLATGVLERAGGGSLVRPADLPFAHRLELQDPANPAPLTWGVRPDKFLKPAGEPSSEEQRLERTFEILGDKTQSSKTKSE